MKVRIWAKSTAWSGVCLGLLLWAGVAEAGHTDVAAVNVVHRSTSSYMSGTTYGTSLVTGAAMMCQVLSDPWFGVTLEARCVGADTAGDRFDCYTTDPNLILALQTMPDYGRLRVYGVHLSTCSQIDTYRGSRYLPPGTPAGHAETFVGGTAAWGSFYGTRVSSDTKQYILCMVSDSATYSYTSCQARDVDGDLFYCSSDEPGMVAAARSLKSYSSVKLSLDFLSGDCIEIWATNGSDHLP